MDIGYIIKVVRILKHYLGGWIDMKTWERGFGIAAVCVFILGLILYMFSIDVLDVFKTIVLLLVLTPILIKEIKLRKKMGIAYSCLILFFFIGIPVLEIYMSNDRLCSLIENVSLFVIITFGIGDIIYSKINKSKDKSFR